MHTQLPARQSPPNLPNFPDWFSQCHQGGWVGNDANQHHCVQLYNGVGTIDTPLATIPRRSHPKSHPRWADAGVEYKQQAIVLVKNNQTLLQSPIKRLQPIKKTRTCVSLGAQCSRIPSLTMAVQKDCNQLKRTVRHLAQCMSQHSAPEATSVRMRPPQILRPRISPHMPSSRIVFVKPFVL